MKSLLPFAFLAMAASPAGACSGTQQANSNDFIPVAVTSGVAYTNVQYYGIIESSAAQDNPEQFITGAAINSMAEIQLSQLAQRRAQNQAVKSFASMMVKDHTGMSKALKKLAASKNIDLPGLDISSYKPVRPDSTGRNNISKTVNGTAGKNPDKTLDVNVSANRDITEGDMDINQKMNKLMISPGKQFDPQYVNMMATDHQKAISMFEQGAKSNDAEVKAFAMKYLPALKTHLKMLLALKNKVPVQ